MKVEIRNDSVFISGYVNAVERLSKPIRETLHGKIRTFLERIKAGVFRTALKRNKNVLVLLNHDNNRVLASTEDGNAILEEDNIGLKAEITITDKEVVQKAREGKLSGWSFGFIANDDEISTEGNNEIRTVTDMELLEVSILDDTKAPAYYGTSIESREGGARVVEIRAENFTEENNAENEQKISIEQLAELVASKVIEALKTEEKAEEEKPEVEEKPEAEEKPGTEEKPEAEEKPETEEKPEEEENRSIDYSAFEDRLNKLKK
jgi:HK97 family phage prohead protease